VSTAPRQAVRLAEVHGRALDGTPYRLPEQLPGEHTLVILAFRQRHQPDVDRWIELAIDLGVPASPFGATRPMSTAVIEVPLLGRRWLPARRFIDGGMASGIADPVVLARTITAYTDPVAFLLACGLGDPAAGVGAARTPGEEVEVLLATRDGVVTWATRGAPGPDARQDLGTALAGQPSGGEDGGGGGEFQPGPGSDPEAGPGR
jgi:hypothetical protein